MSKIIIKNAAGEIIKELDALVGKTLLSQIKAEGVELASACHTGICGACMCMIEAGEENVKKNFRGEPGFPLGDEEVMTCIGGVSEDISGDIVLTTMD